MRRTAPILALILLAAFTQLCVAFDTTITQLDISIIKSHADAFNQSRNYLTAHGPAEDYCLSTGTFLAHQSCFDIPTCTATANLVCTVSGSQGCMVDVLAIHILAYKNGVSRLNAAYSKFLAGYQTFSTGDIDGSLNTMESAFDSMKAAADEISQSKLRMPDQIPCPCTDSSNCCLGRCPEARFNYTAILLGKARINDVRLKNCLDGTPGGQCSASKPAECVLGRLVENSYRCGCPNGMRQKGSGCEPITCLDGGTIVPYNACSTATIGKKCAEGILISKPSECGCPPAQLRLGETCYCPNVTSQTCNITNVTKRHNVTYIFDGGYTKTAEESYTFEKMHCYKTISSFEGAACTALTSFIVNSTPNFITPDPDMPTTLSIACGRCPVDCTRQPPTGLACGECACPKNFGFCSTNGERTNATNPAYCENGLLLPQKPEGANCTNGYECQTNECRNALCYNRRNDLFQRIIDWLQRLFGV